MNDPLLGIQISKFRKAAGMTQEELGEAVYQWPGGKPLGVRGCAGRNLAAGDCGYIRGNNRRPFWAGWE